MLESQSQKVLGLLCDILHQSAFSSMAVRRKRYRPRHRETGLRIGLLMHVYWKTKTFLPRVTVTLTITQVMILAVTSHSGLTLSTYFTCSPQVLQGVPVCL